MLTVICRLLMMNVVFVRNMYSASFRINTYEKVHPVGPFIQYNDDNNLLLPDIKVRLSHFFLFLQTL